MTTVLWRIPIEADWPKRLRRNVSEKIVELVTKSEYAPDLLLQMGGSPKNAVTGKQAVPRQRLWRQAKDARNARPW